MSWLLTELICTEEMHYFLPVDLKHSRRRGETVSRITTMRAGWRVKTRVFSTKLESSRNCGWSPAMAREESRE